MSLVIRSYFTPCVNSSTLHFTNYNACNGNKKITRLWCWKLHNFFFLFTIFFFSCLLSPRFLFVFFYVFRFLYFFRFLTVLTLNYYSIWYEKLKLYLINWLWTQWYEFWKYSTVVFNTTHINWFYLSKFKYRNTTHRSFFDEWWQSNELDFCVASDGSAGDLTLLTFYTYDMMCDWSDSYKQRVID